MGAMRPSVAAAAVLLALAAPRRARGDEGTYGPELALRLGAAWALGAAADDLPVDDVVDFQVPLQVDGLWRFGELAAGVYGSYGIARAPCGDVGSCSASVWRLGVQGTRSFGPILRGAEPWLGLAAGYEWAKQRRERESTVVETTWRGFELLALQGGLEWRLARRVAVGPVLLVGAGRYANVDLDTGLDSASAEIPGKALHYWIHLGVRGRLVLGEAR
jgi:hypothetical protein